MSVSLVVIMILLPEPNQSCPPASDSSCVIELTSSRTRSTLLWRSLRLISDPPLNTLPNSVIVSSPMSSKSDFCRLSKLSRLSDFSLTLPRKHDASNWRLILSNRYLANVVLPIPPGP
ncbi:hypothetical protein AAHE18_08G203700 [Arachis hypogaea]